MDVTCGDANPNGNIAFTYKGGCREKLDIKDAYRCTGCGGWFHKECILKHFEEEKEHDWGRKDEREKILEKILSGKGRETGIWHYEINDKGDWEASFFGEFLNIDEVKEALQNK